jgi:predicted nucleic acid-binding protein
MIVISDTSPLNYLVLTDLVRILPALFQRVLIPQAVFDELRSPQAPDEVKQWIAAAPDWLAVQSVVSASPGLAHLDPGEREVVSLALHLKADLLLLDEAKGRQAARAHGFAVAGTLGLLDRAAARGLTDLSAAIERLKRTTFRVSPKVLNSLKQGSPG